MTVRSLDQLDLRNQRVLLRVDYNVPMKDGRITDDSRIRASLPTLEYLLAQGCRLTLMSHLGRPKGKPVSEFSTEPCAKHLSNLLGKPVAMVPSLEAGGHQEDIQMLENLRFSPGETANDPKFAALLAQFGDVYVNDAFGAAHRAHASIDAVTRHFSEKGAGLLLMKELHYLQHALQAPERPFTAILGGSKISDKLKLIENLVAKVDCLIIGGGMSYTFLKARGLDVGNSLVEEDFLSQARELENLCRKSDVTLLLPMDHLVAQEFKEDASAEITQDEQIEAGYMGLDIGPETINLFTNHIKDAKTLVWNGPMGVFEWEAFSTGTISVAEAMAENKGLTVIGGGDSVAAAVQAGVSERITHISTGGGASLKLLGGQDLPGVKALER